MADYTLSAKITASIDDFQKKMSTVQKTFESVSGKFSNIGKSFERVGSKLTSSITKPAMIAASALSGITLVKGFDRLIGIDNAKAKLKGLGHDAESVEAIMESATASVKGTAFGLDEAATTAANAVAAGIKPGKELTKYLTMTADAAAIAGISMSEMGSILNKVQTGQTVYTEDLEQLADRGLPVYQWLAKEAGVAASEVKQLASEGQISSQMLYSAIQKNIGGAAKTIGDTSFSSALANMGASLSRIGANFLDAGGKGGGFFSQLKPLMSEFTSYLGIIEAKASELGVKFGESFTNMVNKVKEIITWFNSLSPTMQSVVGKAAGFGTAFVVSLGPVLSVIGKLNNAIGIMSKGFGTISLGANKAGESLKAMVRNINQVRGALAGDFVGPLSKNQQAIVNFANIAKSKFSEVKLSVSGVKSSITTSFSSIGKSISSVAGTVGSKIGTMASSAGTSLLSMGKSLGGAVAPFLPAIAVIAALTAAIVYLFKTNEEFRNSMLSAWGEIQASFAPVLQSLATMISSVVSAIMPALQQLGSAFASLVTAITPVMSLLIQIHTQILAGIIGAIASLISGIAPLISMLIAQLSPVLTKILSAITPIINSIASSLIPIIQTVINILTTYVIPVITQIITVVASVINRIIQIITPIITFIAGVIGKIISVIATVIGKVAGIFNTVKTTITNVWSGIKTSIGSVITGIINVIRKVISPVTSTFNKVKTIIVGVFNKIKSAWGGLTGFVSDVFSGISGAVQSLVSSVKGAINTVIGGINGAIGLINKIPGVEIGRIPYLKRGTDDWQGGFAYMNEAGRGELTYLPNGSQVIPHDLSVKYAKESARLNNNTSSFDVYALGEYIVSAVSNQGSQIANSLERGVGNIRMVTDNREVARMVSNLGFRRG